MVRSLLNKLFTLYSFTKNIRTTGAIYETSPAVERSMCTHVNKDDGRVYIEFGLGHGNITRQILASMGPNAKLYSFEINTNFIQHVSNTIIDKRLKNSKEVLKKGSVLTIVQYSKKILSNLQAYYDKVEVEKKPNLPMAYIFHCHKT